METETKMRIAELADFLRDRRPKIMETRQESAVLIPFVEKDGETHILFEVRSDNVPQPGEVCFPGGRLEGKERAADCAVRETKEELGIPKHCIKVLGPFDILHNYTNATIYTFIGMLSYEDVKRMELNREEVKEAFLVPVSFFTENRPYVYKYEVVPQIGEDFPYHMLDCPDKYNWRKGSCTVPIFQYEGRVIWGITARILCHLLETLKDG